MSVRTIIRCISLADAKTRREHMRAQLDRAGHEWTFFDACTALPADLPYDERASIAAHGRPLTKGELGCFASHWQLWQLIAAEQDDAVLLALEDDVLLDCFYFAKIDEVAAAMRPYGYLRLYAKVPAGLRLEGPFLDRHIGRFSGRPYGTQGYLLTPATARRFLASINQVVRPVDDEMDRFWAHGIPARTVFPFPLIELNFGSTIESKRRQGMPLTKPQRLRWETSKGVEKLRRHLANFTARLTG